MANPKFDPLAGQPYDIMFTSDRPKTGEGNYGTWWLYTIEKSGVKHSWFPSQKTHEMIERAKVTNGCHVKLIVQQRKTSDGKPFNAFKLVKGDSSAFFSHGDDSEPVADGEAPPPNDDDCPLNGNAPAPTEADKATITIALIERKASIMKACLVEAVGMCEAIGTDLIAFTTEDIRALAISMSIDVNRSGG